MFFSRLILMAALLAPPQDRGTLIDRVIAVVGTEVVTESELMIEARVALAFREGEYAATADLPPELLNSLRDYIINQLCVMITARRLGGPTISKARVEPAMKSFRSQFISEISYQAFLRRYGISEAAIRGILERDLKNDLFIKSRLRNRFSEDKDSAAKQAEALEAWLTQMKRSLEIRVVGANGRLELLDDTP